MPGSAALPRGFGFGNTMNVRLKAEQKPRASAALP